MEQEQSLWQEMVANKRSPHTRKAYEIDLRDFFKFHAVELSESSIMQFLQLDRSQAMRVKNAIINLLNKQINNHGRNLITFEIGYMIISQIQGRV
ncbi:MAG: hypothetical protein F6K18_32695 [Okeania sp. SIO2C2]|uniref:hypothetical protein n=1 Tax=Okeania sp. SIO2C2 TaxID=2607787 RepID=UPI0013BA0619|nr:hypothetical protein [Okeania sp. SIO2C2]NEP91179.1 hypothetical protein [Okeania sp. SIO2C2]